MMTVREMNEKLKREQDARRAEALRASDEVAREHARPDQLLPAAKRKLWAYHVVDFAHASPSVKLVWVRAESEAGRIAGGKDGGLYIHRSRTGVVQPVVDIPTALGASHEAAHGKGPWAADVLEREASAWELVRETAPYWDESCQEHLAYCIGSYLKGVTNRAAVLAVDQIEQRLLSPEVFARHRRPFADNAIEKFEDALFVEEHGSRFCESGYRCHGRAVAQQFDGGRYACRPCAEWSRVEQMISSQLARRDAMRARGMK
jgi:hypothetical protein